MKINTREQQGAKQPEACAGTPRANKPVTRKSSKSSGEKTPRKAKKKGVRTRGAAIQTGKAKTRDFPVVGIGASAGGLEALDVLFANLPPDTGMAFVVVTHQHPGHASLSPELLAKVTEMTVVEAADGTKLQPNHVYVGPTVGYLQIFNATLHWMALDEKKVPRLPIDSFFRSLADDQQEGAICIVLSGTGTDGTLGLKAIKAQSGMAMVQQPQSAKYAGMPSSAIATGLADYVSQPAEMPRQLLAYVTGPYLSAARVEVTEKHVAEEELQRLNAELEQRVSERTAELQRREREFHALADNVPALFSYVDTGQRYRFVNKSYERFFGRPASDIIGKTVEALLGPELYARNRPHIKAVLAGQPVSHEVEFDHANSRHTMQVRYEPNLDADGRVIGFFILATDIGDCKQVERELRESEEHLRTILATVVDAIVSIDQHGIITTANAATERMFGYTHQELIGRNVTMLMPSPYREQYNQYIADYLATGEAKIVGIGRTLAGRRKNGSTFPVDLSVNAVDHLGIFTGVMRDISNRKDLERHLAEVRVEESRYFAHEIHEGIGSQLTGVSLLAQALQGRLRDAGRPEANQAQELLQHIYDTHEQVRRIARDLLPVNAIHGGLREALRNLGEQTDQADRLVCEFACDEGVTIDKPDHALHLYRIAQEAVANALRHGRPKKIVISLERHNGSVVLSVQDDGVGISVGAARKGGMGLRALRYRADQIGATVVVTPLDGGGTVVACTYPQDAQSNG